MSLFQAVPPTEEPWEWGDWDDVVYQGSRISTNLTHRPTKAWLASEMTQGPYSLDPMEGRYSDHIAKYEIVPSLAEKYGGQFWSEIRDALKAANELHRAARERRETRQQT